MKDKHTGEPWMTKGLERAGKKKNLLYKKCLQLRTDESEEKYKLYKIKLITIMRLKKKEYYSKMLEDSKNNMQRTWKVLNNIIWNQCNISELPNYFFKWL